MESWTIAGRDDKNIGPDVRSFFKEFSYWRNIVFCCSEHLKTVPDLLETLMSEKRLLQASILLIRSLKIINNPDMLEIGAVADLRGYLNSQEVVRSDLLPIAPYWFTLV